jgi:hypothetical protein
MDGCYFFFIGKGEDKISENRINLMPKRGGGLSYFLYDLHHWLVCHPMLYF